MPIPHPFQGTGRVHILDHLCSDEGYHIHFHTDHHIPCDGLLDRKERDREDSGRFEMVEQDE